MSIDSSDAESIGKVSHQELPYMIHAKTNVPYLVGTQGHTIIAVELKKFGWAIKLVKNNNAKYLIAKKGKEKWFIQVVNIDIRLIEALRKVKDYIDNELETLAEENKALPVIALVTHDSASLISAKTFTALSLAGD